MRFRDKIGGLDVELQYDGEAQYLAAFKEDTGEPIIVEKHWWLGWKEFHPDTTIWKKHAATRV
jgi:hypothetical protein